MVVFKPENANDKTRFYGFKTAGNPGSIPYTLHNQ